MTQPVKVQKIQDEFGINPAARLPTTPAEPRSTLKKEGDEEDDAIFPESEKVKYRSATAMLLYIMRWSRVETMNTVRKCSRFMKEACKPHMKALNRVMSYIVGTPNRGLFIRPTT